VHYIITAYVISIVQFFANFSPPQFLLDSYPLPPSPSLLSHCFWLVISIDEQTQHFDSLCDGLWTWHARQRSGLRIRTVGLPPPSCLTNLSPSSVFLHLLFFLLPPCCPFGDLFNERSANALFSFGRLVRCDIPAPRNMNARPYPPYMLGY